MTERDAGRAERDAAAGRDAQRRLAEACAARDWDGVRAPTEAGARVYRNELLERLLETPETQECGFQSKVITESIGKVITFEVRTATVRGV